MILPHKKVVEHTTWNPTIEGSNPGSGTMRDREKMYFYILAFILNFRNNFKMFHRKTSSATFLESSPFIKFPNLKTLLILFSFNQAIIFLFKYSCLGFNKSVFNWTFCQLLYSSKSPIV
jgi:hypothetical protein